MKKNYSAAQTVTPPPHYAFLGSFFLTFFLLTAVSCRQEPLHKDLYFDLYNPDVVTTNIRITGGYAAAGGKPLVRVYFTNGSVADGYIDDTDGAVMLYDDDWNDQSDGLFFRTLRLVSNGNSILLSREFHSNPSDDTVTLNIDSGGMLQFRQAETGNPADPGTPHIPIDTLGEFALINRDGTTRGGVYLLKRDMDMLGGLPTGGILSSFPYNWTPVGDDAARFTGIFDGGGKAITNLYANWPGADGVGLFGVVGAGGIIRNVRIQSGEIAGAGQTGGVAGAVYGGSIIACSNAASVAGTGAHTGGIAGRSDGGVITACANSGAVTGAAGYAGGVAGVNLNSGAVIASYSIGRVRGGSSYVGGVIGQNDSGTVAACYFHFISSSAQYGLGASNDGVNAGTSPDDARRFADGWPSIGGSPGQSPEWGTGNGSGSGKYWHDIGGWNSGAPVFPQLWWDNP